jgi:DNA-binding transcriptional MerR regulator
VKRNSQARGAARELVESLRDERADVIFGIGDLCEEFRVSPRTLRFYETKGLLSPRRINGLRVYTRRDRARLALILRAKAIGSKLSEINHYLDLYGSHGEGRSQQLRYVIERTDVEIGKLERKRANIEKSLQELRMINQSSRRLLEERRQ